VAVRPEKIRLTTTRPTEEVNQVGGTVRDRTYFGSFTVYNLELPGGRIIKVSESNVDRHRSDTPEEGQAAWATWPDTAQVVLTQ
jgi:putrescine transport system ATP-binding protein